MKSLRRAQDLFRQQRTRLAALVALGAACALAVALALGTALGGTGQSAQAPAPAVEHSHESIGRPDQPIGERAFIDLMLPHHALAVAMSQTALETSRDPSLVDVARDIVVQQPYEIGLMERWRQEWFGVDAEDLPAPALNPEALRAMGMDVDLEALARARPYPPAFYTAMIPHHRAAATMARQLLLSSPRPDLRRLAEAMIRGQSEEIRRMRAYRAIALGQREPPAPAPATREPITP